MANHPNSGSQSNQASFNVHISGLCLSRQLFCFRFKPVVATWALLLVFVRMFYEGWNPELMFYANGTAHCLALGSC